MALYQYLFSDNERKMIAGLMSIAQKRLKVNNVVLMHGDFGITHIFYKNENYTRIIDFGEIQRNNRLFDFATFIGFYQDRTIFFLFYLIEGYCELGQLSDEDFLSSELMALFMLLRQISRYANGKMGKRKHFF